MRDQLSHGGVPPVAALRPTLVAVEHQEDGVVDVDLAVRILHLFEVEDGIGPALVGLAPAGAALEPVAERLGDAVRGTDDVEGGFDHRLGAHLPFPEAGQDRVQRAVVRGAVAREQAQHDAGREGVVRRDALPTDFIDDHPREPFGAVHGGGGRRGLFGARLLATPVGVRRDPDFTSAPRGAGAAIRDAGASSGFVLWVDLSLQLHSVQFALHREWIEPEECDRFWRSRQSNAANLSSLLIGKTKRKPPEASIIRYLWGSAEVDVLRPRCERDCSVVSATARRLAVPGAAERHAGDELGHGGESGDGADDRADGSGYSSTAPPVHGLAGGDDSNCDGGVREHHGERQEHDAVEAGDGPQVVRQHSHEEVHGPPAVGQQGPETAPRVDERSVDRSEDVLVPAGGRDDRYRDVHRDPGADERRDRPDNGLRRLDWVANRTPDHTEEGPHQPQREGEHHPLEPVRSEDEGVDQARSLVVAAVGSGVGGGSRGSCGGRGHRNTRGMG